jgi:hypothetical protein
MRIALLTAGLLAAWPLAQAEIIDIRWSADGRFTHSTTVAAGKFVELCGKLPAGQQVRWQFDAGAPLDFNVHYHVGKDVVYPVQLNAVASGRDLLDVRLAQDYCWMWRNKSATPATLAVTLQR